MTLFLPGVLTLAVSATCGPRPVYQPLPAPELDGGSLEDGGVMVIGPDCRRCEQWGGVEVLAPLPMVLDELSGLAVSSAMPGVIYAHNDSGDTARLFAMSLRGVLLAELKLPGATAVDWEDMALARCDTGFCLYLADIGDNLRQRVSYTVYRAREPDLREVLAERVAAPIAVDLGFDALPFVYPNGERHNAEVFLAHPTTGELYILTKEVTAKHGRVFKFPRPLTPGQTATLIDLGNASIPSSTDSLATGGDIHPCGDSLLVRMYNRNVELRAAPDAGFETAFTAEPIEVPMAMDEPQGEAIAWGLDGQSYFTASESTGQSLHRVQCVGAP